jgi:hypothetical protein
MDKLKKAEVYLENGKCTIVEYTEFTNEEIEKTYFFGKIIDGKWVNTARVPWTYLIIFLD